MPEEKFVSIDQYDKAMKRIEALEKTLKNVRGEPIISGYVQKRLVLNENFNVVELNKRISDIESRLSALEA